MFETNVKLNNITIDGIDFNKTQLLRISEEIFNIQPIVESALEQETNPLKKEASLYILKLQQTLQKIQQTVELYQKKEDILQNFLQLNNNMDAVAYAENANQLQRNDILQVQREIIVLTDLFTVHVQNILGKKMELIYVYQSRSANTVQVYKIEKIEDLLHLRVTSKGGIEARLSATKKSLAKTNAELVKKQDYVIGQEQAKLLDITYKEIIRRYNKYRYGYMSLVLWNMKTRPKWHGMRLYQRGDLAQAYSSFVFNRQEAFQGNVNNPPQTDIETFMKLVEDVDATFGGIQGDIFNAENNTEYAIKSLSASPQQILSTIAMAKDLMTGSININNFNEYKKKWIQKGRNIIQKMTEAEAKAQIATLSNQK